MTTPCAPCDCATVRAERDMLRAMLTGVRDIAADALSQQTPPAPPSADEPTATQR